MASKSVSGVVGIWRGAAVSLAVMAVSVGAMGAARKKKKAPANPPAAATTLPVTTRPVDVHMRSPEEERLTVVLPEGYHLELVASEPDVISPNLLTWDGDGRMYVAEMRSYMLDIDGSKSHTPISRVSRWEDTDGDGTYDKHTVFADKLMLPRMVLPLDDRVLIRETDTKDIYSYRDTNGDGVSDKKERVWVGGVQEGNLEHQPSGLIWDIDNWIYVTHQQERFRFTHGRMESEHYDLNVGQWGIAVTDTGQLIFATAGAENPAHHFQVMPQYGAVSLPGEVQDGFRNVYPIALLTDVQGGLPRVSPQGGLNVFTACCGGSIYRGDALPHDLYGDYILPEPVGRLIRRAKVVDENGKTVIKNAYDKKEFIASTDPNFRPVWTATGPDGCLYICDMYHGIIQEANWTKEGSYLRGQIKRYGLDKNINGGRIWRVVHDGYQRRAKPHMLEETPAELVRHLSDPNGWWRDTAQKLIVLRGDKSVVPALREMAMNDSNPIARLHALWTLDGLDSADQDVVLAKLKDADPRLRAAAVRVAEAMVKKHVAPVVRAVRNAAFDPDPNVARQVCLSMFYLKDPSTDFVVNRALEAGHRPEAATKNIEEVVKDIRDGIAKAREAEERQKQMEPALAARFERGKQYFQQMCVTCHAATGTGTVVPGRGGQLAPALKGSQRLQGQPELVTRILLNGLTGPHDGGRVFPEQMPTFRWADDERIATVLTYARNEWGNEAAPITPEQVKRTREETAKRNKPYLVPELPTAVVEHHPRHVVLSAGMAEVKGQGLVTVRTPGGAEAVGFGIQREGCSMTWHAAVPAEPGVYEVKLRCQAFGPGTFTVKVGDKTLKGVATEAGTGELDLGAASVSGNFTVEFRPATADQAWAPMNVEAVVLDQLE